MQFQESSLEKIHADLTSPQSPFSSGPLYFIGDLGGTSLRLAFAIPSTSEFRVINVKLPMVQKTVECVENYTKELEKRVGTSVTQRVVGASMSVCGPVTNGVVAGPFNNIKGILKLENLAKSLFPPAKSIFLNDLNAGANGVKTVSDFGKFKEYFAVMWEGVAPKSTAPTSPSDTVGQGSCVVMAPGTGLGIALLFYDGVLKSHGVVPLELGHTSVQSVDDLPYQMKISKRQGRGQYLPEYEDMISGRGLLSHYYFVTKGKKNHTAEEISALAAKGDPDATEAFRLFNKFMMRVCSQAAMAFVPDKIILIGNNIVSNAGIYKGEAALKEMKRVALDHSAERMGFMSRVTYLRQTHNINLNLVGCVGVCTTMAHRHESKL